MLPIIAGAALGGYAVLRTVEYGISVYRASRVEASEAPKPKKNKRVAKISLSAGAPDEGAPKKRNRRIVSPAPVTLEPTVSDVEIVTTTSVTPPAASEKAASGASEKTLSKKPPRAPKVPQSFADQLKNITLGG